MSSIITTYPSLTIYIGIALVLSYLVSSLWTIFKRGLRDLPGPLVTRFSGLYRLSLVYAGNGSFEYRQVHHKYRPIVRVDPNHVSISDAAAIPQIYRIISDYLKVRTAALYVVTRLRKRRQVYTTPLTPIT